MLELGRDVRGSTATVLLLTLSLSTILLFAKVKCPMKPAVESHAAERVEEVPLVVAALRHKDFARARRLIVRLVRQPVGDPMTDDVDSAKVRRTLVEVAFDLRGTHYGIARQLATALEDKTIRSELLQIVDFAEARSALERDDLHAASSLASALQPGLKRALLFTALTAQQAAAGNRPAAVATANSALENVPQIDVRNRRRLLAMIARALLPADRELGLSTLDRALHEDQAGGGAAESTFRNGRVGNESGRIGMTSEAFVEVIGAGSARQTFSLAIPGAKADLEQLLIEHHGRLHCLHRSANESRFAAVRGQTGGSINSVEIAN